MDAEKISTILKLQLAKTTHVKVLQLNVLKELIMQKNGSCHYYNMKPVLFLFPIPTPIAV